MGCFKQKLTKYAEFHLQTSAITLSSRVVGMDLTTYWFSFSGAKAKAIEFAVEAFKTGFFLATNTISTRNKSINLEFDKNVLNV